MKVEVSAISEKQEMPGSGNKEVRFGSQMEKKRTFYVKEAMW